MSGRGSSPREVLVRFVRTAVYDDRALAARARRVLGADELRILERLRAEGARRDYLAAHALRRRMLAEVAGSDPARLRFRATRQGCPRVIDPPGARRFSSSLSHADGIALCAVSEWRPVGADVESARNVGGDPMGVAALVCSRREEAVLRALPETERAERLLHLWTLKEAVAKATGLGIGAPLSRVVVGRGSPWRLASWWLNPHHVAAVAVPGGGREEPVATRLEEERHPA